MLGVIRSDFELQGSGILNRHTAALILVCALLFTACGETASPTNTPVSVDVSPTDAAPASAVTTNTIQVNGDVSADVQADNFYIAPVKADDESVVGTMLYLNQGDTRVVFIRFPKDAQAGTYPIVSGYSADFNGSTTTANYIDQTSDPAMQFAATGGMLTLQSVGDNYAGTFEFPAADPATGKSVTVSGTFANLKLP